MQTKDEIKNNIQRIKANDPSIHKLHIIGRDEYRGDSENTVYVDANQDGLPAALMANTTLHEIQLSGFDVSNEFSPGTPLSSELILALEIAINNSNSLIVLKFETCDFNSVEFKKVLNAIADSDSLRHLHFYSVDAAGYNEFFSDLGFAIGRNDKLLTFDSIGDVDLELTMNDEQAKQLAVGLSLNSSLTSINLSKNDLRNKQSTLELVEAMLDKFHLTSINLSGGLIFENEIVEKLADFAARQKKLRIVEIDSADDHTENYPDSQDFSYLPAYIRAHERLNNNLRYNNDLFIGESAAYNQSAVAFFLCSSDISFPIELRYLILSFIKPFIASDTYYNPRECQYQILEWKTSLRVDPLFLHFEISNCLLSHAKLIDSQGCIPIDAKSDLDELFFRVADYDLRSLKPEVLTAGLKCLNQIMKQCYKNSSISYYIGIAENFNAALENPETEYFAIEIGKKRNIEEVSDSEVESSSSKRFCCE